MKYSKEWFYDAPWGKVALMSWGRPSKPPVLLAHGFMDSAASFIPLVEYLSDDYYCVALDFPGHGLSDPFPMSTLPNVVNQVEALRVAVERMGWRHFAFLSHSMGTMVGAFYNAVYPHQISKLINIDPEPPLYYHSMTSIAPIYYNYCYGYYYGNYSKYTNPSKKTYTYEEIIKNTAQARKTTEQMAEIVLSRSLIPTANGRYRLSYDQKIMRMALLPLSREMILSIMTTNTPPTLHIHAMEQISLDPGKSWAVNIIKDIQTSTKNHRFVYIEGGHDIHITHAKEVAEHVTRFLDHEFPLEVKAKL